MPNEFSPYDFIIGKDSQKHLNFKACVVEGKFTWDDLEQPMVPHGYWTEARIKQLSNKKKNNYFSKQNAEFFNTTNVKQTEEKENKRFVFQMSRYTSPQTMKR